MRVARTLTGVEVHAEGEQGTCFLGGVYEVPGVTMREKLHHLNEVDDSLRRFLCFEPRGRPQTSANLVFESSDPDGARRVRHPAAGPGHAMSGSNTICVVTALLETGAVPMTEPETVVVLETAAGLVRTVATCRDGRCERVTLDGVPSFVDALDVPLDVPGFGRPRRRRLRRLLLPARRRRQLGLRLERGSARAVVEAGPGHLRRGARDRCGCSTRRCPRSTSSPT